MARSIARLRAPSACVAYDTHITVSGTTFMAQLGDRPVDVVVGQAAGVELPGHPGPLLLKLALLDFIESAADGFAIFLGHLPDGCHDFGHR
jgi:hypothetical protein